MKIKRFNENIDPYGEEDWENESNLYKIGERDKGALGYLIAKSEQDAKNIALDRDWYEDEFRRYIYAQKIKRGPYKELWGKQYDEQYEIELERAQARYNDAKRALDSLEYCINKIKKQNG